MIHVKHLYFIESKYRTKNAGYKRVKLYEIISEEVVKRRPRLATILFLSGDEAPLAKEPLGSNLQILQWIATARLYKLCNQILFGSFTDASRGSQPFSVFLSGIVDIRCETL